MDNKYKKFTIFEWIVTIIIILALVGKIYQSIRMNWYWMY